MVSRELTYKTSADTDVVDITADVSATLADAGVRDGAVTVFVPGSTAALTTIEYESGAIEDLRRAIDRLAPQDLHYDHDARWGDGNGYAHVRAALLGPSLHVPVFEGELALGTWQQIVLLDFDNRPRARRVMVQVIGE
ncbi:MAG: secondary thiamine-phosphate synthase enzyme YjbQ [Myxococcales bacterium]|nr:secondary thiamine-phosphate synthase enzyme YjbQ [Myxococcales bacterium]